MTQVAQLFQVANKPQLEYIQGYRAFILIKMKKYNSISEVIEQLEMPNYQTKDGLHSLKDNAAFVQLKEVSQIIPFEMIEELKNISNNYQVLNGQYVISKNVLDMLIHSFEDKTLS